MGTAPETTQDVDKRADFASVLVRMTIDLILLYSAGGLIKPIGAVTAICSPTVNCYRRLHTPWALDLENWGIENRMASFRVKNYSPKVIT